MAINSASTLLQLGFSATYNFVDFDSEPASLNVFDKAVCYPEAKKVTFQVKFPGELMYVK